MDTSLFKSICITPLAWPPNKQTPNYSMWNIYALIIVTPCSQGGSTMLTTLLTGHSAPLLFWYVQVNYILACFSIADVTVQWQPRVYYFVVDHWWLTLRISPLNSAH